MPPQDPDTTLWFAEQVQPHETMLRAWLRGRFQSENDVDEVVQETYRRLLRAREQGEVTSPKAFLFAVARNLALDRFRHRAVVPTESLAKNEGLSVIDDGEDSPEIIAHNQELEPATKLFAVFESSPL